MWNERYAEDGYAYGAEPNDFLRTSLGSLQSPVLCLAAGEGRNAVWLAEQGLTVHAVDSSSVGTAKLIALAESRGVSVMAEVADLATYNLGTRRWGSIVAIFAHLPPPLRSRIHAAIPHALVPGGTLVMEMYTPRQLGRGTGGPPVEAMLYTEALVRSELGALTFEHLQEVERSVVEGRYHTGNAVVLQVVGRRG